MTRIRLVNGEEFLSHLTTQDIARYFQEYRLIPAFRDNSAFWLNPKKMVYAIQKP